MVQSSINWEHVSRSSINKYACYIMTGCQSDLSGHGTQATLCVMEVSGVECMYKMQYVCGMTCLPVHIRHFTSTAFMPLIKIIIVMVVTLQPTTLRHSQVSSSISVSRIV